MKRKTRYVLLGLLRVENLTGYEIKKIIDTRMSFFWQESYGQIYPELNALLKEDYIFEVRYDDKENSGHEKIKYAITDKGVKELKFWMEAENEKESTRSEFFLKMYLSTDENSTDMKRHIEEFYDRSQLQLEMFRKIEAQLIEHVDIHSNHRQILNVLSLGIKQQELYCNWSKQLLEIM